jgi:two-component system, OmpR family, sensor kinase
MLPNIANHSSNLWRTAPHHPMTIRLRLTLWYTALLGATLILFSGIVYSALAANLRTQFQNETGRQATEIAKAVAQQIEGNIFIIRNDPNSLQLFPLIDVVDVYASNALIQVIGLDGRIMKQSEPLERARVKIPNYAQALPQIREGVSYLSYFTYGNEQTMRAVVYSVPLVINGQIWGAVQVVRSARQMDETLEQVSRYLVLGTALSLIVAAIVGAFLARRALSPINTITQAASSITRTKDLERRLDITDTASEIGELAATFNEMLDRVQLLFRTQERLVADVSHELRTPLTTVQGNLELLQRIAFTRPQEETQAARFSETLQETLREVEGETTRMSRMINDLLLLAQADSGGLQLQLAPVEMDTLLLEVYRQTRRLAEQRKGPNAWDIRLGSEDQALVWGDRERLRQLLLNLTDNALKYTPIGGSIILSLENREGWVKVAVSDTGFGIPADQHEHVFERFYRIDKARSRELGGSGLGLSIVKWIAQAHQGRVTLESQPHVGSTFTLWLPELQPRPAMVDPPQALPVAVPV